MKHNKIFSAAAMIAATIVLSGCQDEEVIFEPDCIAFAGDRITIAGDSFVWERYTDARKVDGDGNEIEPYPDFPKTGSIERDGKQLTFSDSKGGNDVIFHVFEKADIRYLLRDEQYKAVTSGAALDKCALRQRDESAKTES